MIVFSSHSMTRDWRRILDSGLDRSAFSTYADSPVTELPARVQEQTPEQYWFMSRNMNPAGLCQALKIYTQKMKSAMQSKDTPCPAYWNTHEELWDLLGFIILYKGNYYGYGGTQKIPGNDELDEMLNEAIRQGVAGGSIHPAHAACGANVALEAYQAWDQFVRSGAWQGMYEKCVDCQKMAVAISQVESALAAKDYKTLIAIYPFYRGAYYYPEYREQGRISCGQPHMDRWEDARRRMDELLSLQAAYCTQTFYLSMATIQHLEDKNCALAKQTSEQMEGIIRKDMVKPIACLDYWQVSVDRARETIRSCQGS